MPQKTLTVPVNSFSGPVKCTEHTEAGSKVKIRQFGITALYEPVLRADFKGLYPLYGWKISHISKKMPITKK